MQTEKLKSFCTVVDYGSLTKAAEILYCSQPAITKQISSLEADLGYKLFDRNGKHLSLNESGRIVYENGSKILTILSDMQKRLFEENRKTETSLSIGVTNFIGIHLLPKYLNTFKTQYSETSISFTIDFLVNILGLLQSDQVSFALVPECDFIHNEPTLSIYPFLKDNMILVMAPGHPWSKKDCVSLKSLENSLFYISQPSSATRTFVEKKLKESDTELKNTINLYSTETIKQALYDNKGVTIISSEAVKTELEHGILVTRPIKNFSCVRQLYIVKNRSRHLTKGEQAFIDMLKDLPNMTEN